MRKILKLIILSFLLSGCSGKQIFQTKPVATPAQTITLTALPTKSPIPTATDAATPDLTADYFSLLPEIPSGFEWKILPEIDLAVLIPDGWFYKEETPNMEEVSEIFVSKENIDEVGRFSTGLTVIIFQNFKNTDEAEQFSQGFLTFTSNLESTKEVLKAWDQTVGTFTVHHLRIRAEYPNETGVNKNKIVHYSAAIANNSVYWSIFESPESMWEETLENYGIVLDYIVIFYK